MSQPMTFGENEGVRVVGVIDLRGGRAVHAQGGCRLAYRPVSSVAGDAIDGDAARLARVYVGRLGIRQLYVADLDAIEGGAHQDDAVRGIVSSAGDGGAPVWLDAGCATSAQAERARTTGAAQVVVGLETLPSFDALREIAAGGPAAFSLDLRGGRPVAAVPAFRQEVPEVLAARAAAAGAAAIIVLDLDRVGSGRGLNIALLARIRDAVPGITLLAGGGVRGEEDLRRLDEAGYDGALVATALHSSVRPLRFQADLERGARR
jgi:HisA/HisF family protein